MTHQITNLAAEDAQALRRIIDALDDLEFAAVEITVHHRRIVQIERREKVRFDTERGARSSAFDFVTTTSN